MVNRQNKPVMGELQILRRQSTATSFHHLKFVSKHSCENQPDCRKNDDPFFQLTANRPTICMPTITIWQAPVQLLSAKICVTVGNTSRKPQYLAHQLSIQSWSFPPNCPLKLHLFNQNVHVSVQSRVFHGFPRNFTCTPKFSLQIHWAFPPNVQPEGLIVRHAKLSQRQLSQGCREFGQTVAADVQLLH